MAGANFGDPGRDVVVADGALDLGCDLAGGEQVAEERRTTPVAARVVHNTMAQRALAAPTSGPARGAT